MDASLLATKLQIPPQPHHVVPRPRLLDALEQAVPHHKLILISAPAGSGKTTLLIRWAHSSHFPIAWLSIGEGDNDLERFLRYLLAAWEQVDPGIMGGRLDLLLGALMPDIESALSEFVNAASATPDHMVLVLNDYHLIEESSVHQALTFLLDHLPPTFHFMMSCRGEPPLPLARYRAHDEVREFHAEDLRFSPEETAEFLSQVMDIDLAPAKAAALQTQLEGWAAGLRLVTLGLQQRLAGTVDLVVSGQQRFIADYLREDVLAPLTEDVQQFLLQTSILDQLCGALCEAITGRKDGQQMLESLERENLFIMPLDERREWFRYHGLFADFLREELNRRQPDEAADLHRRAAEWYLIHDLPDQAMDHAVDAGDAGLVGKVLERYLVVKLVGGEVRVVQRWLRSIPEAWQSIYPIIGLARAGLLLVTGQFDACARRLDEIERLTLVEREDTGLHRARVTAMRCNIACFQNDLAQAETFAERALRALPEDDLDFRAGIYGSLGDTYRRHGRWREAKESYLKLLDYTHAPAFRIEAVHLYGALADLALRQGHLRDAEGYWRKALKAIEARENWGSYPLPLVGWVHIRQGELSYEWNRLEEAQGYLLRGLEYAELGGDVRALIAGYLIMGRLMLTRGEVEVALEYLERARQHVEDAQFPYWTSRFEQLQLELWLAQDRLRTAVEWADEVLRNDTPEERSAGEIAPLVIARILIVKGDGHSLGQALRLLESLLQAAGAEGRTGVRIEALALQAMACGRRGDSVGAMTSLETALRLAEPEGYMRRFIDLGLPMARLLQDARSRNVMPDYVERLLDAFDGDLSFPQSPLPEPLTGREQEILELLSAGLTNQEIAEELVISSGTVKKHASNIYGKLSVSSRTEAAARARELGLLE